MMDMSPLPHKVPYFQSQVTLPSPSPVETPNEESYFSEHDLASAQEAPTPVAAPAPDDSTFLALPE